MSRRHLLIGVPLCLLALGAARPASAECAEPHYQVVKTRWDYNAKDGVHLHIVVGLQDIVPERLLCLANALQRTYDHFGYADILIFTSANAARHCNPNNMPSAPGSLDCRQLHAQYVFNAKTNQRLIELLPMGRNGVDGETIVELPAKTLRPCALEYHRRCFLTVDVPDYPDDVVLARVSGRIVAAGTFNRQGRAASVHVERAELHDPRGRPAESAALVKDVLEKLHTWRLEPAAGEDPFRITFTFEITDDLSQIWLQFRLPNEVVRRGTPSLAGRHFCCRD